MVLHNTLPAIDQALKSGGTGHLIGFQEPTVLKVDAMQISPEFSSAARRAPVPEFPLIWGGAGMDTLEVQDRRLPAMARARRAATLAAAKGRLIRCTVPGSSPNCLAMTRTAGLSVAHAGRSASVSSSIFRMFRRSLLNFSSKPAW